MDRSSTLAAELVQLNVDVLVVTYLPGTRAAKEATKIIPIVMLSSRFRPTCWHGRIR